MKRATIGLYGALFALTGCMSTSNITPGSPLTMKPNQG